MPYIPYTKTAEYISSKRNLQIYIYSMVAGGSIGAFVSALTAGTFGGYTITVIVATGVLIIISTAQIGKLIFSINGIDLVEDFQIAVDLEDGRILQDGHPSWFVVHASGITRSMSSDSLFQTKKKPMFGATKDLLDTIVYSFLNFLCFRYSHFWAQSWRIRFKNGREYQSEGRLPEITLEIRTEDLVDCLAKSNAIAALYGTKLLSLCSHGAIVFPSKTAISFPKVQGAENATSISVNLVNPKFMIDVRFRFLSASAGLSGDYLEHARRDEKFLQMDPRQVLERFEVTNVSLEYRFSVSSFWSAFSNMDRIYRWAEDLGDWIMEYFGAGQDYTRRSRFKTDKN